jgi:drug/metabolite transporter (DMT)-like permease
MALDTISHTLRKSHAPSPLAAGYAAIVAVVLIWAGFALTIRAIDASPLTSADVALIRFGAPLLVLLSFLPSRLQALRAVKFQDAALIVLGGGAPFFFLASEGGKTTSAAYVGALIAGTTPISVALLSCLFERRTLSAKRLAGLGLIVAGVIGIVEGQSSPVTASVLHGVAFLLMASLLWGMYTIGLRRSGADAISCALMLCMPSFAITTGLVLTGFAPTNLGHFTFDQAIPFLAVQGIGVGVASTLGYAFAIRRIGAAKSATIGSLAPVLASLLAIPILGESLTVLVASAIATITVGVIVANRA